jgi:hypothetical protein
MSESGEKAGELVAAAIESDSELQAMRVMLSVLVPLKHEARSRVVDYVLERLGMLTEAVIRKPSGGSLSADAVLQRKSVDVSDSLSAPSTQLNDIRSLTKQKAPRSANEMAALVAYYLSEIAPEAQRKQTINIDDIRTYFKQATFRLPSRPEQTLINAKNAGYFESTGGGQYRLNPVGYNLVVHSLPAGDSTKTNVRPRRSKTRKPPRKGK